MKNYITIISIATLLLSVSEANSQAQNDTTDRWSEIPSMELPSWQSAAAISSVKGEDLRDFYTSNITNTLYGRLPGLTVMETGAEPGADGANLLGRGVGTFSSGTSLFYVIDGFPATKELFERLTPGEIESIQLLKDASATAIYGNRGANGVLVVKTKRGESGALKIDFSARAGFQQPLRMPQWLGAYDYASLYNEALANEGKAPAYGADVLNYYKSGKQSILYPDVNWQDEIMSSMSPLYIYSLTASGGNRSVKYLVHFNGVNNYGLLKDASGVNDFAKKQSFSRYNFRTNVDVIISKRLSASMVLGGSIEDKTTPGRNESTWNIIDLASTVAPNAFPVLAGENLIGGNLAFDNPVAEISEAGFISYNGRTAQASLRLTEQLDFITKGLSISGAISFNNYYKAYSNKTRTYMKYLPVLDMQGKLTYETSGENTSLSGDESSSYQWRNIAVNGIIAYDRVFADKHYVNAMMNVNYDDYTVSGTTLPFKNLGFGGRFSYSFDKRYVAEFSFGYYGNDNFPAGSRFGFFPSGALVWNISEEGFLKDSKVVNLLRLRASYGLVGNSDIGGDRYMFNQYYNWGSGYYFGSSNTSVGTYLEGAKANPFVTWEKERKLNIALEATLFDGLYLSFDWFRNHRYDILTVPYSSLPDWLGFSKPIMNVGVVSNTGFEAVLGYRETKREFKWFAQASAWYAHNNVIFNSEAPQLYDYRYSTGHIVGQPFALEAIGFFRDQEDIDNSPRQVFTQVRPGDIKYKDQNNDNVINEDDYYPLGYTDRPEFTLAMNLGFEYKGIDLSVLFQGALNRTVYLEGKAYHAFQNNGKISSFALGRWTPETAETATYPRLSTTGDKNNYQYSSFWQRNGNFLKLRNVELGYTISSPKMQKAHIQGLRIYLSGTNLFSLDHMDGFADPEVLYGYPAVRTFNLGFNLKF